MNCHDKNSIQTRRRQIFSNQLDLNLRNKLVKCYILGIALCGAETWAFRKEGQKYLESFGMWCWRRIEEISWTDRVRNGECYIGSSWRGISYI